VPFTDDRLYKPSLYLSVRKVPRHYFQSGCYGHKQFLEIFQRVLVQPISLVWILVRLNVQNSSTDDTLMQSKAAKATYPNGNCRTYI